MQDGKIEQSSSGSEMLEAGVHDGESKFSRSVLFKMDIRYVRWESAMD